MQNDSSPFPHLLPLLSHAATAILAVTTTLLASWLGRKKQDAEVGKLTAETRHLEVSTDLAINDAVLESARVVAQLVIDAERLRDRSEHWERKAVAEQRRADLLQLEVNSMDLQMRKLDGYVKAKGLHPSELDTPRE